MKTRITLELGANHQGDINTAKKMINDAAALGVWGVKLQKRDVASIPPEQAAAPRNPANSFGPTFGEHRAALEFNGEQIEELLLYAEKLGLALGVTVFDLPSLELMQDVPLSFIKLPSQFYSDRVLNDKLGRAVDGTGAMSMASTGMHTVNELINVDHFGCHDVTFYCRSIYPCTLQEVRIHAMRELFRELRRVGSAPGYSSHEINGDAIPMAVLLGAEYIERHYTLNKKMKGSDHSTVSSTYLEMQNIIEQIESVEDLLDDSDKLCDAELKIRRTYRGF